MGPWFPGTRKPGTPATLTSRRRLAVKVPLERPFLRDSSGHQRTRLACWLEPGRDGVQQCGVRKILAEIPNHYATKTLLSDIGHLEFDGGSILIGPIVVAVKQVRRLADRVAVRT